MSASFSQEQSVVVVIGSGAGGGVLANALAQRGIDVVCLEGRGHVSVGEQVFEFEAGQRIHWPTDVPHRLWTEDSTMLTLMAEHPPAT